MYNHQGHDMVENAGIEVMTPEAWMALVAAQQQQQVEEHQSELHHLAEQ